MAILPTLSTGAASLAILSHSPPPWSVNVNELELLPFGLDRGAHRASARVSGYVSDAHPVLPYVQVAREWMLVRELQLGAGMDIITGAIVDYAALQPWLARLHPLPSVSLQFNHGS